MARSLSRRGFLKGSALAAGALALGAFPHAAGAAAAQDKPQVFFTRDISLDSLLKLYSRVNQNITGKIAIKLHTGEPNGPNILPVAWAQKLLETIPQSSVVECNVLYNSPRQTTEGHRETLKTNGWTFTHVDIMDEDGDTPLPIPGGRWLKEVNVGSHLLNYDSMLVLTHFKGHTMGGFGGSNKNIGIGCADGRIGKAEIHTTVGSDNMWSISEEELMERISESAKATVDYFKDHISFINVMRNMSVSCDCEGVSAAPVVTPNVGILASLDICAIDQASVDLIYAMKEEDHHDLVERIKTRHGLRQLSYMQELGMGNRKYKLIDLDNNQSPLTLQEAVAHVVPFVEPKKVTL